MNGQSHQEKIFAPIEEWHKMMHTKMAFSKEKNIKFKFQYWLRNFKRQNDTKASRFIYINTISSDYTDHIDSPIPAYTDPLNFLKFPGENFGQTLSSVRLNLPFDFRFAIFSDNCSNSNTDSKTF